MIAAGGLFEPEFEHQAVDGSLEDGQSGVATVVEAHAIVTAVRIAGAIIDLGRLVGSHGDITSTNSPARGNFVGGCGSGFSNVVEILEIGG